MKIILFIFIISILLAIAIFLWKIDKKVIGSLASEEIQKKIDNWDNLSENTIILTLSYKNSHFLYRLFVQFMFIFSPLIIIFGLIILNNNNSSFGAIALSVIGLVVLLAFCIHLIPYILYPKFDFYKDKIVMRRVLLYPIILKYQDLGFYTKETTGLNPLYQAIYTFKVLKNKEELYINKKKKIKIYAGYLFNRQINDLLRLIEHLSGVYYDFNNMGNKTVLEPLIKKAR